MGSVRCLLAFLLLAPLAACSQSAILGDRVVVDELKMLADGEGFSMKMDPGTYKLDLTSSADVSIEWIGAPCPRTNLAKTYSSICEMPGTGQLVIKNPSLLGLGATASVTVKVTRLAR